MLRSRVTIIWPCKDRAILPDTCSERYTEEELGRQHQNGDKAGARRLPEAVENKDRWKELANEITPEECGRHPVM